MDAARVRQILIDMLTAETGCTPEQLTDDEVHVVSRVPERKSWPEHRSFDPHPGRIAAVTLGKGAVISVEPGDLEWANDTFRTSSRDEVFRDHLLSEFISGAADNGLTLHGPYPRFTAPSNDITEPVYSPEYTVRVIDIEAEQTSNPTMIDRTKFTNALSLVPKTSGRPTVFAAVAEIQGEIVGVAGVSKDSNFMYQIGIDILPAHRGNGLAPAMTAAAARAVFEVGGLPYYGTTSSNIASMRTALAAGLRPTWVEVLTRPA